MPGPSVMLLPGAVLPAALAYGALLDALGGAVDVVAKDLEVYATETPPADFSLDDEVRGVLREAEARGWESFHLVGYSGGGAAALAVAARASRRPCSLALLEPAWAGSWDMSEAEQAVRRAYDELDGLAPAQFMAAFQRLQLRPGVEPQAAPAGPPPPWMANRPAGIAALTRAFGSYDLDRASLARFGAPVYYALGGRSNPALYGEIAARLGRVIPDFTLEIFEDRHHFDPPHRMEPARLARSLQQLWARAGP